jgi:hypothetical protein
VKNRIYRVLNPVLMGALSLAAAAPVAMRVELEPLGRAGDKTEVAVTIQIAPMDRGRIGSNAIVSIELDEGRVSSGSPRRAVRMEDDGSFRIVVEWPPGEHDLRVGIEDPSKEDTGLWVGKVRIPDLGPGAAVAESDDSTPASESAPEPASDVSERQAAASGSATPDDREEAATQPVAAEAPENEAATPEPFSPTAAVEEESADEAATEAAREMPQAPSDEPPVAEVEPVAEEPTAADETPEPESEVIPTEAEAEPEPVAEPDEIAEEPALVEPLRAEPPPHAGEPEAPEPSEPETSPSAAAVPATGELRARYEEWERAGANTREFSLIALRGRQPAQDLDPGELRLRIEGSEVPIERLGGPEAAPLLLGIAIDVMADDAHGWAGSQGSLAPIAERTGGERGRLFVANPSGVGDWDAEPETRSGAAMNVARLVVASLERFEGQRGRTFLVVLTDGRNEPTKDEWQSATEAAGAAGVPILVVALWDQDFSQRTRKNLKKLTVVSGGSLFLVQGSSQVGSAADRFGRYIDGGYALRFSLPPGGLATVSSISLSTTDRAIDISAPKSIR